MRRMGPLARTLGLLALVVAALLFGTALSHIGLLHADHIGDLDAPWIGGVSEFDYKPPE